jgi:hypothetical protein
MSSGKNSYKNLPKLVLRVRKGSFSRPDYEDNIEKYIVTFYLDLTTFSLLNSSIKLTISFIFFYNNPKETEIIIPFPYRMGFKEVSLSKVLLAS